jgi:hypothetical protein
MTTLIRVGNSEGERRCDAKCYDAIHPECDCVCGGMNHGKGAAGALENTRCHAESILKVYKERTGEDAEILPQQGDLFGGGLPPTR